MKYEMEEVVWIIRKELRPSHLANMESIEVFVTERTNNIIEMIKRDQAQLKQELLNNNTNTLTGSVPLYESDIIKAQDLMHRYLQADMLIPGNHPCRRALKKSYDKIKNTLKGLLWYIHQHLKMYCNRYQKIPNEVADEYRVSLTPMIERIENTRWFPSIYDWLQSALLKPLRGFMDNTKSFHYYQLQYVQGYIYMLNKLLLAPELTNELIIQHLLMQSYNDVDLYDHLVEAYRYATNELPNEQEKLFYCRHKLKNMRQLHVPDLPGYNDARPDTHILLCNWLEEEIGFIEKPGGSSSLPVVEPEDDSNKIRLHLSVYELALAIRLLMEAGLITENSFPKIARYLTANFLTHKKEGLSLDSFRKKSYQFERSVVNKIKDKIITLMNLAQKF